AAYPGRISNPHPRIVVDSATNHEHGASWAKKRRRDDTNPNNALQNSHWSPSTVPPVPLVLLFLSSYARMTEPSRRVRGQARDPENHHEAALQAVVLYLAHRLVLFQCMGPAPTSSRSEGGRAAIQHAARDARTSAALHCARRSQPHSAPGLLERSRLARD